MSLKHRSNKLTSTSGESKPRVSKGQKGFFKSLDNTTKGVCIVALVVVVLGVGFLLPDTPVKQHVESDARDTSARPTKYNTNTFIKWIESFGGKVNHIRIGEGVRGRGLFSRHEVPKGKFLYQVPEDVWITAKTLKHFSRFKKVMADPEYPEQMQLSVGTNPDKSELIWGMLLEYANPRSHWRLYLESLPKMNSNETSPFPLLWDAELVDELQSPTLVLRLKNWKQNLQKDFDRVKSWMQARHNDLMGNAIPKTFDEFLFRYFQLISRSFDCQLPMNGDDHLESMYHNSYDVQPCMLPFCDLVNHDYDLVNLNQMVIEMPSKKAFYSVDAPYPLKKGSELMQSYAGEPSNLQSTSHYFVTYGLVNENFEDTRGDFIVLKLSGDTSEILSGVSGDGLIRKEFVDGVVATLKVDTRGALAHLRSLAATTLAEFPTTVEEDMSILGQQNLPWAKVTAVRFRARLKQILHKMVKNIDGAVGDDDDTAGDGAVDGDGGDTDAAGVIGVDVDSADFNAVYTDVRFPFPIKDAKALRSESMLEILIPTSTQ